MNIREFIAALQQIPNQDLEVRTGDMDGEIVEAHIYHNTGISTLPECIDISYAGLTSDYDLLYYKLIA